MPKETEYQTRIITSMRGQGGYGRKWSSMHQVGPPDLILSHSRLSTFFMEVKKFDKLRENFHRTIGTTPKQKHEMSLLFEAGAQVMVGIILAYSPRQCYLAVCPHHLDSFGTEDLSTHPCVQWKAGIGFDLLSLLNPMPSWAAKQRA